MTAPQYPMTMTKGEAVTPRFHHLLDYELTTRGAVPLTLVLFVSAARDIAGEWYIERVQVLDVVTWLDEDQGFQTEFREIAEVSLPFRYLERLATRLLKDDRDRLHAALDVQAAADVEAGVVHEIR